MPKKKSKSFDQQLAKNLDTLHRQIAKERLTMYAEGHGCTCTEDDFCPRHAVIADLLVHGMVKISAAVEALKRK